jgi:tetratricopeptide (TPR) repeat protein
LKQGSGGHAAIRLCEDPVSEVRPAPDKTITLFAESPTRIQLSVTDLIKEISMKASLRVAALACFLAAHGGAVMAADSEPAPSPAPRAAAVDKLGKARELIASKQWQAAIAELKQVNATSDANWNNLMGYSHRKAKTPDFATAEKYYLAALSIDPKHAASQEYLGELRLQQGDLAGAEKQLAALSGGFLKSDEYKQLKAAIDAYKSNGNRYVSKD